MAVFEPRSFIDLGEVAQERDLKNYGLRNLAALLLKFRISKSFRRLDYFKNHRVFKVYSKFDALIFPSFIESLGLPILEAKLFKMPIICSNLPYAKELLGNKGFFFNPLSTKSLYKSLMSYLSLKNKKNLHQKLFQYSNRKKFRSDVLLKKLFI